MKTLSMIVKILGLVLIFETAAQGAELTPGIDRGLLIQIKTDLLLNGLGSEDSPDMIWDRIKMASTSPALPSLEYSEELERALLQNF